MPVRWTNKARRDLSSVDSFISRDNPTAALDTVLKIISAVETLTNFPDMGRSGRIADTRELIIPGLPFIVPYRVRNDDIIILRVYHTSRKWPDQV